MNWVAETFNSSIGKKIVMALTGLLLCGFLIVHLGGNVLMYVGPEAYNTYAHTLHSQEWAVKMAEVVLALLFVAHIVYAVRTGSRNSESRGQRYKVKKSKIKSRFLPFEVSPENLMLVSGIIVLCFLVVHLAEFTFGFRLAEQTKGLEPFDKALVILRNPASASIYVVGCLLLGWHLMHAVSSSLQTFGLNHPKYNGLIVWAGMIFAVVIALGFASFPIWAAIAGPEVSTPVALD